MFAKVILFAFIGASASTALASANSLDECSARLGTNRYYGAFVACVNSGKFTPEHLDAAIESERPINPVEDDTRTGKNGAAKDAFAVLIKDPRVIALWSQTRQLLLGLREKLRGQEAVHVEAETATKKVLDPHEHFKFNSVSSSVAFTKLPDGRGVIAHMLGNNKLVVTDLATKQPVFEEDVPDEVHEGHLNLVNWFQSKRGELWLYVSSYSPEKGSLVFKLKWGERAFKKIDLQQPTNQVLTNAFCPAPGIQAIRVEGGIFKEQFFNIASGKPASLLWMKGYAPGDWTFENGKEVTPPLARGFHVSKVFAATRGPVFVRAGYNAIEIDHKGEPTKRLNPPGGDGIPTDVTFYESEPGKELLAIEYSRNNERFIKFWDLSGSPSAAEFEVDAKSFASYFWFRYRNGAPFLGMQAYRNGEFLFTVVDPLGGGIVLSQKIPGYITAWMQHGEDIYFSSHRDGDNFIFRLEQ